MRLRDRSLSVSDFRSLGAFEIYAEAELVAFTKSEEIDPSEARGLPVPGDLAFRLEDLFAAETKFRRQLWLARRPGVLPSALLRRFAHDTAREAVDTLKADGTLHDIRLEVGLKALAGVVAGQAHVRSLDAPRAAVRQAVHDHEVHATERAATGCWAVHAALDPQATEAAAGRRSTSTRAPCDAAAR